MTTAMFAPGPRLWAPLQGLLRWFAGDMLPVRSGPQPDASRVRDTDTQPKNTNLIANYAFGTRATSINKGKNSAQHGAGRTCGAQGANVSTRHAHAWPVLRVMRVLEAGQAPASVGRMVISGRMADVCAELDRLVAHEAALH